MTIVDAGMPGYWRALPAELAAMGRSLEMCAPTCSRTLTRITSVSRSASGPNVGDAWDGGLPEAVRVARERWKTRH